MILKPTDIHHVDPFDRFEDADLNHGDLFLREKDLDGWHGNDPIFAELIDQYKPELIIEVGTWKGQSAITMAKELRDRYMYDSKVVCVDTWLGALEFWQNQDDPQRYKSLHHFYGYPSVYFQFLSNCVHENVTRHIIPFPQTSLIAARWFAWKGARAEMIYLDASHDFEDVLADMKAYWPLVAPGGVMFGDDFDHWKDVQDAVIDFTAENSLELDSRGSFWMLKKECA